MADVLVGVTGVATTIQASAPTAGVVAAVSGAQTNLAAGDFDNSGFVTAVVGGAGLLVQTAAVTVKVDVTKLLTGVATILGTGHPLAPGSANVEIAGAGIAVASGSVKTRTGAAIASLLINIGAGKVAVAGALGSLLASDRDLNTLSAADGLLPVQP